ncbi:transcriptional regulator family: Fungal Specific TF [Penicillium angulare]|uniref:transcriptional regulator family: Fungal Specific TF n=1 Tax=Penicillium angulare TaxID=116970 RepID=UPI002540DFA7|nr:transcriptional regulator family: Fungal Specific TF [Penicillium angulare]KAJ5280498.1 transcriptional regulator family: Fungal Specific TF [Penicillium angulare]
MASPSSISTRLEENDTDWHYGTRAAKRHKRASIASASKPSPREIGFMRESQNDGCASFLGSSSGIHFIRHVYSAFARRSADLQQNRARDRSSVPGEDDRLQRDPGNYFDTDDLWLNEELDSSLNSSFSFENLVHWTRGYFENWHPIFPCLHAPTVLKAMETLAHQGVNSISNLDLTIIRCLVSISLSDSRQIEARELKIGPVPTSLVFQSVQHIMQEIHCLLAEPTTLPLLQAAFTAQLTLASILRLNAASRAGGVITRSAFHLGLHRCPGRFACFSNEEIGIRRRLFWSIYSLERYLSQALGAPLSIRDDDIDVCYPGAERHVAPTSRPPDTQRLKLLSHLAKFARIRGLILELRNKSILHSNSGAMEASHVNGELSQWWNEVYDDVNPIEEDLNVELEDGPALAPYHRLLLVVLRHEAIISMNRPLLAAEKPSPDYKNALQTCIGSSRSLLAALKKYMSSSSSAPLTWPSFTWTTWMACLILMYASCEGEFPVSTAMKYAAMGISILKNMALRGSSWPETCIEAIGSMESALLSDNSGSHNDPSPNLPDAEKLALQNQARPSTFDGRSARTRNHPSASRTSAPNPYDSQGSNIPQNVSLARTQPLGRFLDPAVNISDAREPSECAIISPPDNPSGGVDASFVDGPSWNGQSSAGLIFGNVANSNAPFYPGTAGQESLPFSDPSLFMNDFWSVADGPWIIDGNLL